MYLKQLLTSSQVVLDLEVTSKKRLFEEIGFFFERTNPQLSRHLITDCLFARERLGSTGLGFGVAIPHGRMKGLKEPRLAAFQLKTPISFDASDGQPVEFLFALLVPEKAVQKHLDLLAEIAEILGDEVKRAGLKAASSTDELLEITHKGTLR